jgi:hypothetical protein
MIQVTATKRNGVTLVPEQTFLIDAEKIVSTRNVGLYAEIEYAETYDRRKQPIKYLLTTNSAAIASAITGAVETLTVYDLSAGTTYTLVLQQKYITDVRESKVKVNGTLTACRQVEYVAGAWIPTKIYVSDTLASIEDSTPAEVTTTEAPTTTAEATTTEEATTTAEPTTTG